MDSLPPSTSGAYTGEPLKVYAIQYNNPETNTSWTTLYPSEFDRNIAFTILEEAHFESSDSHLLKKVILTLTILAVTQQLELEM